MHEEIARQHRQLDGLFAAAREALSRAEGDAPEALAALAEALAAHFEQEDHLYYPAVGSLRPEHRPNVERFASDHRRFLARLEELGERLRARAFDEAAGELARFAEDFAGHEAGEEALLRALEAELEAVR